MNCLKGIYKVQDPLTGRRLRHFESIRGRKADAQKHLNELLVSVEQDTYVKPNQLTVAQFLEEWLRDCVRTNTAPRTDERYEEIVRVHLVPALGSLPGRLWTAEAHRQSSFVMENMFSEGQRASVVGGQSHYHPQ